MRVLVACEFSGIVRDAFIAHGHDAWSCDFLDTDNTRSGNHLKCDVIEALDGNIAKFNGYDIRSGNMPLFKEWDLMIAFPPCTHLAVSGARWFETKRIEQRKAIWFFMVLAQASIKRIAIENPIGIMSTHYRKPDQIIQPWQFGHDASKATCLWLKNLPKLTPTEMLPGGRHARRADQTPSGQNKLGPSPTRAADRSRTYQGIANAMAEQWG